VDRLKAVQTCTAKAQRGEQCACSREAGKRIAGKYTEIQQRKSEALLDSLKARIVIAQEQNRRDSIKRKRTKKHRAREGRMS
jgi:hypothetical protein